MGKKEKKKKKRTLSRAQLLQGSGDFKRKKTKLGKTEKPTNFTSTEFRSRALVLPSQSVLEEKGPIVTQRHLNLKDLVAQLSHTNPQVRRDAVYGLRELHRNYPNSLCDHIGLIFERLLPLIEDSERSVRHAVHALLRVLIPHLDHILIAPFLPLIAMYISSALTHLSEDVRLDALVVLNLILDYFPRLVKGLLGELFPNFIALLSTSRGSTSTSTKGESGMKAAAPATLKISPGARLTSLRARETILSALIKLLRMAFSCPMTTAATNDPVISDAVWEAEGPNVCFLPRAMAPTQPVPSPHDAMSFNAKELLTTLAPVLLECWIECEPASLEGVSITKLDVMAHVLNVFEILLSAVCVKGESSSGYGLNMKDLDKYLVTYFPIVVTSKDPKILRTTADVNLSMCSVMCYFIRNKDVGEEEPRETSVLNFLVAQSWNEETRVRGMDVSFLLGVIQRIIVHVSELRRSQLLKTVGSLFGSLPATSAGKRACLSFMTAFFSDMQRTRTLPVDIAKSWLHALPKLIWQLQAKSEVATELALRVLHAFARRASRSPESQALYDGLQAPLVPFFRSVLRTKTSGEMRYVWGPFVHLSAGLQCRALDLLFFFSSLGEELVQSLCACCKDPRISPHTLLYALDILDQRRDALPRAHYLSLLLCVGTCPAETREIRGRWDEVQDGCVRALKVLRLGSFLLRVLWPALDAIMSRDDLTLSQWRGTIQILAACCEEGHELFVEGGHPTPDALNLASAVRSALPIQLQRYLYFLVSHNHPCDKTPLPLLVQVVPPLLGELISLCGSKIAGEEEKKKKKEKKEEEEEEEEEETDHLLVCLRVTGAVLADDRMRSSLGSCSQSLKIVAQNVDALLDRRRPCGFSTDPVYGEGQRLRSELALCGV